MAAVARRLDEISQPAAEFEQRLFAHIDQRVADQSGQARAIADKLEGAVGSKLAALEAGAGKIGAKLVKSANRQLGQAYTYGYPLGMVYPTNEQALYGLQSGDYLGSMGLAAPGDSLRGAAGNDLAAPGQVVPVIPDSTPGSSWNDLVAPPVGLPPPVGAVAPVAFVPPPPIAPPAVVNPPVVPTGGFNPPVVPLFLGGGVTPPPVGAPPATTEQGICHCPPGWIGVAIYPGGPPYCYPGPLLPNIRLNDTYAPYGFDPCGGASPLCQDGTVRPFSGTCGPTSPGPTPPPAPPPPAPPPPPPPSTGCPPGYHWEDAPAAPVATVDVPTVVGTAQATSRTGDPCPRVTAIDPDLGSGADPWQMLNGSAVFRAVPYAPGDPLPGVASDWDLVTIRQFPGVAPPENQQTITVRVPAGFTVWASADRGIIYALPAVPSWGCALAETRRQHVTGGVPAQRRCVPDAQVPAVCPVPDVPHCGPDLKGQLGPLTADEDNVCKAIAEAIAKIQGQNAQVSDWIGMKTGDKSTSSVTVDVMNALLGLDNPVIPDLVGRFGKWLQEFLKRGTNALGCDTAALLPLILNRGVFRFINRWTGAVPEQLLTELDQLSNTVCQSLLPGVGEADRAYLADAIDQSLWECWVKAAGAHVKDAQAVRDAGRTRLSVRQAIDALRKEYITADRYNKLVRQAGVLTADDQNELWQLEQYWPNHTDLITWMGKDSFDQDAVDRFGLDTDFEQKYTDRAKHFGDGAGLSDEQMRFHWRAHWRNVGVGQMLEAYRRLRPDRVPADLAVSEDDLREALKQQDIQPYWIDRLVETGWRVVTREDAVKLYTLHQIEQDDLVGYLQDAGYKEDKARLLADYYRVQRDLAEVKASGVPTLRMAVRRYARGEMTRTELEGLAQQLAYYPGQVEQVERGADLARDMENRRLAIAGVKRRYTRGLVGPGEAAAELAGEGIDADEINELMKWWDQVKKHTGKQVPAATICVWRKSHLISASEQLAALLRLGYEQPDASNIVAQCTLDIANAAQRAQVKAEQQAMKAATQAAKSEAAKAKAKVRSNRTSAPSANGGSANGAAGH